VSEKIGLAEGKAFSKDRQIADNLLAE